MVSDFNVIQIDHNKFRAKISLVIAQKAARKNSDAKLAS